MEELIDIYDANRKLTGKVVSRKEAFMNEGEFMLYALAIVQDMRGRYLITQRTMDKRWAPGQWEIPGGGAHAGETSAEAIVREVREEVGLDIAQEVREPVYSYSNVDLPRGDNYFVDIYCVQMDVAVSDVVLQSSEATDCMFAPWETICALADKGEFLHFSRLQAARDALDAQV